MTAEAPRAAHEPGDGLPRLVGAGADERDDAAGCGGAVGAVASDRADDRSDFWARSLRGWDVATVALVVIAGVTLALDDDPRRDVAVAWGLLAGLLVAYWALGRRGARTGDTRLTAAYLAVLVPLVSGVVLVTPAGALLLFVAYSHVWFFSSTRRTGIAVTGVLTVGVFGAMAAHHGFDRDVLPNVLGQALVSVSFSLLLGLWLTQIAERGEERAELLARLEAAQDELAASHHAAGVLAERERMAREIHDTLAQGFTSVIMLTQTATADLRRDDVAAAVARIELAERTARDNLAEARALVAALAPVDLEGTTLADALGRLARRFSAETGVRVDLVLPPGQPAVSREAEVVLLRAAQEALTNVRRHADAHHVQLVLRDATDVGVVLEVVDDGRGISPAAVEGFGLRGMRDRVASGGGTLDVTSPPDGGTRVRVLLPADEGRMDP
ncbi:sensor histidine kinase [Cellulomonas carbonis]|uniref:histidine kinase n=1 Tax=Cellulomonas carbonis T26 TaxID=947969 RepID=A0A0A0BL80_9CELL|nr:sensor histidine kinase [Cellulomonas carbonis]KGM09248.1 histidine kinase [Cellulomonas carbonis T26]GGC09754.1 two-component sensor histidine kinase [Cellulomonas carbonis]